MVCLPLIKTYNTPISVSFHEVLTFHWLSTKLSKQINLQNIKTNKIYKLLKGKYIYFFHLLIFLYRARN